METEMIRNLGNCGSLRKLERITHALNAAIKYKAPIIIVLDPLVYGESPTKIEEVLEYNYNKTILYINNDIQFPWWDIVKINVLF